MSGEFAFLLACVRRFFQPETPLPSTAGLDWNRLMDLSEGHAVLALFYETLQSASDIQIPGTAVDELRKRVTAAMRLDLILGAELVKLHGLLGRHQIAYIPLKGPLLGAKLYGNRGLRTATDLDLLVHTQDVLSVSRLLEDYGYRLESVLHWPSESALFRSQDQEISFSGRVRIDLHWRLLPGYFPASFDDSEPWKLSRYFAFAGVQTSTLAPEHLLLFLCAHGAKHLWERLGWICDVARLLQVEPSIDWSAVFTQARRTDTSRMLSLGLILASDLLGVDLPPAAAEYVGKDPRARSLAASIRERLPGDAPISTKDRVWFSLQAFQRTRHCARFVFEIFLTPTEAEYKVLKVRPMFYWMYYLFRPGRLAAKYARQWLTRRHDPG